MEKQITFTTREDGETVTIKYHLNERGGMRALERIVFGHLSEKGKREVLAEFAYKVEKEYPNRRSKEDIMDKLKEIADESVREANDLSYRRNVDRGR